jgi:hypothetical protein
MVFNENELSMFIEFATQNTPESLANCDAMLEAKGIDKKDSGQPGPPAPKYASHIFPYNGPSSLPAVDIADGPPGHPHCVLVYALTPTPQGVHAMGKWMETGGTLYKFSGEVDDTTWIHNVATVRQMVGREMQIAANIRARYDSLKRALTLGEAAML